MSTNNVSRACPKDCRAVSTSVTLHAVKAVQHALALGVTFTVFVKQISCGSKLDELSIKV